MQSYGHPAHSFHEAAMIHAAHNGGFPHMMPPHMRGAHGHHGHHHNGASPYGHNGGHHHNSGFSMPPFVPAHMQHYMHQHQQQQFTTAKEVQRAEAPVVDPSMVSPAKEHKRQQSTGTTPEATPSRHLNFSAMENTPVHANSKSYSSPTAVAGSGATGGCTLPHIKQQQQHHAMMMMHQHHLMASGGGSPMSSAPMPPQQFTKRLERELHDGSKEDLVKLVMELCDLNSEVNNYVESKAQLFSLSPSQTECPSPYQYCASNGGSPVSTDTAMPYSAQTPMKSQSESIIMESNDSKASPQTPLDELHRDLESRHCGPEERPFSTEQHPCLRLYSNCRYPTSCFFRHCPRNLCLNFLRGECTSGKDCALVHRIPSDASPQILHMVGVCRGEAVAIPDTVPSSRELFNASTCSDVANMTLDEAGHSASA